MPAAVEYSCDGRRCKQWYLSDHQEKGLAGSSATGSPLDRVHELQLLGIGIESWIPGGKGECGAGSRQ